MGQWHDLDHDPFAVSSTAKPAEPSGFGSAFAQGFKRSLPETKSLLYGATAALGGAVGADSVRDWGLNHYQRIHDNQVQPLANQHTFQGSIKGEHSLGQWAGDTLGNFAGQGLQSAAAGLAGGVLGGAVSAPAGGVGAVPGSVVGAIGGLVAKEGGKKLITRQMRQLMKEQVAAGASRTAARQAGKELAQRRLAQMGGATVAATGLNIGQEIGIGYSQRAQDAQANGESLTRQDALRAIAWGIPAGLVDTAAEGLAAGRLLRGASASNHLPRRILAGATAGALTEGATEGIQAVMERAGANQSLTDAQAIDDYIENLAAGALGGGAMGGISGVRRATESEAITDPPPPNPAATEPHTATDLPPNAPPVSALSENSALVRRLLPPDTGTAHSLDIPSASDALAPMTPTPSLTRRILTGQLLDPQAQLAPDRAALPNPHSQPIDAEFTDLSRRNQHSNPGLTAPTNRLATADPTARASAPSPPNLAQPNPSAAVSANVQNGPLTRALTLHSQPPNIPADRLPTAQPQAFPPTVASALALPTQRLPLQPDKQPHPSTPADSARPLLALPAPEKPASLESVRNVQDQATGTTARYQAQQTSEKTALPALAKPAPHNIGSSADIQRYRDAVMHDHAVINADHLPPKQRKHLLGVMKEGFNALALGENPNPPKRLNTLERHFWIHGAQQFLNAPGLLHDHYRQQASQRREIQQTQQRQQALAAEESAARDRRKAVVQQQAQQRQQDIENTRTGHLSEKQASEYAHSRWRMAASQQRRALLKAAGLPAHFASIHYLSDLPPSAQQALTRHEKTTARQAAQERQAAHAAQQPAQHELENSTEAKHWHALKPAQRRALLEQAGATAKQAQDNAAYGWPQFQPAARDKLTQIMQAATQTHQPVKPEIKPHTQPQAAKPSPAASQTNITQPPSQVESAKDSLIKRWDKLPKHYRQMYARIIGIKKGFYKKWQTLDKDMQESLLEAARRERLAARAWNNADQAQRQDYLKRGQILHHTDYTVDEIIRRHWAELPYLYIPNIINGHIDADYASRQNQSKSTIQKENPASKQAEQTVSLETKSQAVQPVKQGYIRPIPLKLQGWTGSASELAALARQIYTQDLQGTSVENASLGAKIAFTSEGKGEAFGARGRLRSGVRAELVKVLSDLVQSAVKVSQAMPQKGRESDSKAFHTLINALEVDKRIVPVRLTIREAARVPEGQAAHKFYDIVINEKSPVVRGLRDDISTAHPPFEASDIKITDLAAAFNIDEPASEPINRKTQEIINDSAAIASTIIGEDIAHKVYASALETLAEQGVKALPEKLKNQLAEVIGAAVGRAIGKATHKVDNPRPGAILGSAPDIAAEAGTKAAARLLKTFLNNRQKSQTVAENTSKSQLEAADSSQGRAETATPATVKAETTAQNTSLAPSSPPKLSQVQPQNPATIEDFGEKIGGARKDLSAALREKITAGDLRSTSFSKLWPLSDIAKIKDDVTAAAVTALRAGVMKKPEKNARDHWFENWASEVQQARNRAALALQGRFGEAFNNPGPRFDLHNIDNVHLEDDYSSTAWHALLLSQLPRQTWPHLKKVRVGLRGLNAVAVGKGYLYPTRGQTFYTFTREVLKAALHQQQLASGLSRAFTGWSNKKGEFWFTKDGDTTKARLIVFSNRQDYDAFRKAPDFVEKLNALWEAHKEKHHIRKTDTRGKANQERQGKDWRKGQDVTPDQFTEAFGFRGVEFGNWVNKTQERQDGLNRAYDALRDLADLLNVPTKALSLSGKLSLAFGARGKGTAAAHYEPSRVVINLTKTQGAGSLAHEWFHALDNYFARTRLAEIAKHKGAKADNEFITKAPIEFYIKGDQLIPAEHFEAALAAGRPTADNFKQTARHRLTWQHIGDSVEGWTKLDSVRPEVLHAFEQVVAALNQSPMKERAIKADKGKEGYWSQIVERAARAFENYVIASLNQKGQRNDYLANVTAFEDFSRDESLYPYLKADELAPISQAFDTLFSTLKTRTDDQGNVALFSRSGNTSLIQRVKNTIHKAITAAKNDPRHNDRYELMPVASEEVMEAAQQGLDISGYQHAIDGSAIRHTFKNHGNAKREQARGQLTISELDFEHIPDILAAPDKVIYGEKSKIGRDLIVYLKTLADGTTVYLEEVRTGKGLLVTQSMRKYPLTTSAASILKALRPTSETLQGNVQSVNTSPKPRNFVVQDTPKHSRSQNPAQRLTQEVKAHLDQVQEQVSAMIKNWPNAPEIIVTHDLSDSRIPESVRRENTQQHQQGAPGQPEGFYYQGKVYLIASQLKTDQDIARVLFHEVLGHVGLRGAFGNALNSILKEVATARRVDIAAKLKQYGLTDTPAHRLIAAEEVLAELAQTRPGLNLVQRALAAIRTWLRQHIPALRHLPLSDSELIRNYILPARQFVERSTPAAQERTRQQNTPAFERGKAAPSFDLDNLPPLRPARTFKEARLAAKAFQGKPLTNTQTGMVAVVSRKSLDKMLSQKAVSKSENPSIHSIAVANIDRLFEHAIYGWNKPDRDNSLSIKAIHRFFAPMEDSKRIKIAKLTIKEVSNGNNPFYTVEAVDFADGGKQWLENAAREDGVTLDKGSPQRLELAYPNDLNTSSPNNLGPRGGATKAAPSFSAEAVLNLAQAIEQHNTPHASQGPLFSRSSPESFVHTINQSVNGPRGPAWARVKQLFSKLNPKHLRENTRPAWLGALTLRHLAELGKDIGLKQVNDYANLVQTMATLRNSLQDKAAQTADQWSRFQRQHTAQADAMANLMFDATLASVDPASAYTPLSMSPAQYGQQVFEQEALTPAAFRARRRAIHAALQRARGQNRQVLLDQRQQLNTRWQQEKARLRAYPGLQKRFAALPQTGQSLYQQVRDTYLAQSQHLEQALIARIEALITDGNTRAATIARMRQQFESARLRGPYFPLQRFGTFWIHATDSNGQPAFMMYETVQAWQQGQRDLKAEGFTIQQAGRKLEEASQLRGASGSFISDLQHLLERHGTDPALRDEVYQLYLRTLPDVSLRKHYLHRKGTAGYSRDALRAFSANLFHGSFQIARLQFSHQLDTTLQAMKAQVKELAKTDAERAAKAATLYSEMGKRHDWVMNPRDSKAANALTSLGFAWYLGATPAAALVNLSQTAIVSLPVLAAKFGTAKALKALTDTMALSLRSQTGDITTRLNRQERAAYQQWHAMGTIDKSQAHNLAGLSETDSHAFNPHARRAMHLISWLFHRAEVVNREATALAAYRLARHTGLTHEAAISYGHEAVMESHFDYSNANRARWMQSNAAKVLLLFRQYSLNMTWFLWRNLYQSLQGQDAQTKKEARTKLAGVLGMTGVFSGLMGLPLMSVLFSIADAAAAALGDEDDDPFDSKIAFRNFLADLLGKDSARLLAKGPIDSLTGASVGARVSLDELWLRSPNRELEGHAMAHYLLEQAAGPLFGGLLTNTLRGMQQLQDGHTWRGIETMLPKALKDGLKALRYSHEGANTLKGEPLINDMSTQESLLQLSGFAPARLNERYEGMNAAKNFEQKLLDRRRRLMNAFLRARQRGDGRAGQRALENIRAFNRKQPRLAITADSLRQSARTRQRMAATAYGGSVLNPRIAQSAQAQARFAE